MNEIEEKHKTSVNNVSKESQVSPVTDLKHHFLVLPYRGQKGDFIVKSMKKRFKTLLPGNVKTAKHISERVLDHGGRDKLLVMALVITLRRENYQKHCGLTLLDLP